MKNQELTEKLLNKVIEKLGPNYYKLFFEMFSEIHYVGEDNKIYGDYTNRLGETKTVEDYGALLKAVYHAYNDKYDLEYIHKTLQNIGVSV